MGIGQFYAYTQLKCVLAICRFEFHVSSLHHFDDKPVMLFTMVYNAAFSQQDLLFTPPNFLQSLFANLFLLPMLFLYNNYTYSVHWQCTINSVYFTCNDSLSSTIDCQLNWWMEQPLGMPQYKDNITSQLCHGEYICYNMLYIIYIWFCNINLCQ